MDLDLIFHPSSLDDLADGVEKDPFLRQLTTPSVSSSVRSLAATEHSKELKLARQPWMKHLEDEGEEEEEDAGQLKITNLEKKHFAENPHWKHLLWTLED